MMTKTFPSKIPAAPKATNQRKASRKAQAFALEHILDAIEPDGFEGSEYYNACNTEAEKAAFSYGRFMSEYGWHVVQVGKQKAGGNWLSGLALNIAFYNHDIIRLAKDWGSIPDDATEKQEDRVIENYFPYMAMRVLGLWRKHGLT